jgi:protein-disulfide isomerase
VRHRRVHIIAIAVLCFSITTGAQEKTVKLQGHVGAAIGKPGAPLVLVEFTDIECPNCRDFHREVFDKLKAAYIDTGKVLFIHRDLPLPNHHTAVVAAHALRCAGDQGLFWALRHVLLANEKLSPDVVELGARLVTADLGLFRTCMRDGQHLAAIERDVTDARAIGAKNTPTLILGRMVPDGIEGSMISGTATFEELDTRIKALLAAPTKK